MKKELGRKIRNYILHTLFWICVWLFFYYFFSYNSDDRAYVVWFSSFLLPVTALVTYIMVYRFIPRYLLKRIYWKFALYSFYLFVFSAYSVALILYGCLVILLDFNINLMPPMSKNFLFIMILMYMVVGMVSSITILNNNFRVISRNRELENKILATELEVKEQELKYLKSQIHPHFLFNTLNTIYGLALRKSDQTPGVILRLSGILDYILYRVSKPRVSLREEIVHIREYIELEAIRFKDTLKVKLEADEDEIDGVEIAPMLLIPFVENAFKHGTPTDGYLRINIKLELNSEGILFTVSNSFKDLEDINKKRGIGLSNIERRLDSHYNNNYKLLSRREDGLHIVELSLYDLNITRDERK